MTKAVTIRAKYEGGVLKPLRKLELKEGEEVIIRIERPGERLEKLRKYRGLLGKASEEEIEQLLLEAEFENL